MNLAIIVGSTRPGCNCIQVADWVKRMVDSAQEKFPFAYVELVDIAEQGLPFLDEPTPAVYGNYTQDHTKAWSALISRFDAFIFITPEYNRSIPGVLKNAIDFLAKEWNGKSAAIVSYGGGGGLRASEHLRQVLDCVKLVPVQQQMAFTLTDDFVAYKTFAPRDYHKSEYFERMFKALYQHTCLTKAAREAGRIIC